MSAVAFCKIQFEAFFLFLGKCFFAKVMLGQSVSLFEYGVYVLCDLCLDIQAGTELFRFGGKLSAEDTFLFFRFRPNDGRGLVSVRGAYGKEGKIENFRRFHGVESRCRARFRLSVFLLCRKKAAEKFGVLSRGGQSEMQHEFFHRLFVLFFQKEFFALSVEKEPYGQSDEDSRGGREQQRGGQRDT